MCCELETWVPSFREWILAKHHKHHCEVVPQNGARGTTFASLTTTVQLPLHRRQELTKQERHLQEKTTHELRKKVLVDEKYLRDSILELKSKCFPTPMGKKQEWLPTRVSETEIESTILYIKNQTNSRITFLRKTLSFTTSRNESLDPLVEQLEKFIGDETEVCSEEQVGRGYSEKGLKK